MSHTLSSFHFLHFGFKYLYKFVQDYYSGEFKYFLSLWIIISVASDHEMCNFWGNEMYSAKNLGLTKICKFSIKYPVKSDPIASVPLHPVKQKDLEIRLTVIDFTCKMCLLAAYILAYSYNVSLQRNINLSTLLVVQPTLSHTI